MCYVFRTAVYGAGCLLAFAWVSLESSAQDDVNFQHRASRILPAEVLAGNGYRIEEAVYLDDNRYQFKVATDYGGFRASGISMLELRLREHYAIERLREHVTDSFVLQGALTAVKETPAGVRTILSDPLGTLRRVPTAVRKEVGSLIDPLERRAGSTARRRLAMAAGADPETRNPVLNRLLDQLALREDVGRIAAKAGFGFVVPGLGLLATTEEMRQLVARYGPRQIADNVETRLLKLNVDQPAAERFANSESLTSTEKLLFVDKLEKLRGVPGISSLVDATNDIQTESHILSMLEQLNLLSQLHDRSPLRSVSHASIPIVELQGGRLVGIASTDIVYDADVLRGKVAKFRQRFPERDVALVLKGQMTSDAAEIFKTAAIDVHTFR